MREVRSHDGKKYPGFWARKTWFWIPAVPISTHEPFEHPTNTPGFHVSIKWGDGSLFAEFSWEIAFRKVVQLSHSVVSDFLQLHEPQYTRPPCPPPTPGVYPNSCPLCRWCHPTISFSIVPFSSCPQSFQASGSFQMSQYSTSGGQSIGISASTSVPPMNTQDWSSLGWTDWISLQSNITVQKHQFFSAQLPFFSPSGQNKISICFQLK